SRLRGIRVLCYDGSMRTLLTLALAGGLMATSGMAQEQARPEPPVVVTQGEGTVRVAPDRAYVRVAAEARAKDPREAQGANAAAMTAVQQRLAASGVAKDAIRTVSISLQQEFDYHEGRQTPRGYLARNTIEVRVDDLARLG